MTISRIGPTFCAMPPCTSTRLSCSCLPRRGRHFVRRPGCGGPGSRRPRLMPNSGSPGRCLHALDQLDARPHAARVLPAAAGAGQPFAQDRAGRHQAPLVLGQRPVSDCACPVARMQTAIRQASRLVETASREPLGMPLTVADQLDARSPGPTSRASRSARLCSEPSMPGRHDARGDHRGLEQPQVVLGEVEHLGQAGDVGRGAQVDAGQAQQRLVDDAEVGLHRRPRVRDRGRARPGRSTR